MVSKKSNRTRQRTLRSHILAWQSYSYKQRFARIAFLDRLQQFRTRELMAKVKLCFVFIAVAAVFGVILSLLFLYRYLICLFLLTVVPCNDLQL